MLHYDLLNFRAIKRLAALKIQGYDCLRLQFSKALKTLIRLKERLHR